MSTGAGTIWNAGGVADVSDRWLTAVLVDEDLEQAWPLTDSLYRRLLATEWLLKVVEYVAGPGADLARELADTMTVDDFSAKVDELVDRGPEHLLWRLFSRAVVVDWQRRWPDFDPDLWGCSNRPRRSGDDTEDVIWVYTGGRVLVVGKPLLVEAHSVRLRWSDGAWRFAGPGGPGIGRG